MTVILFNKIISIGQVLLVHTAMDPNQKELKIDDIITVLLIRFRVFWRWKIEIPKRSINATLQITDYQYNLRQCQTHYYKKVGHLFPCNKMPFSKKKKTSSYLVLKVGIKSFTLWIQSDLVWTCVNCGNKSKQKNITENCCDDKYFTLAVLFL